MEIPKNDNSKVMANKAEGQWRRRISDTSCPPQHADISQHMCYMYMYTARIVEVNVSLWAVTTTTTRAPKKHSRDAGRDEQTEHELPKLKQNVEYDSHRKRA
ncbi:hypothetical protein T4E_6828 [Trichinella pseudospiralis]|uniref:Uncharacterized protein n=1 Tax=Trichinella pseudospiralis TaxID=6337 RepID=A0A0V0Y253_TRIPS|nr:hypothetical protein T4E_6828 [Trichinella pseudospiralis]